MVNKKILKLHKTISDEQYIHRVQHYVYKNYILRYSSMVSSIKLLQIVDTKLCNLPILFVSSLESEAKTLEVQSPSPGKV